MLAAAVIVPIVRHREPSVLFIERAPHLRRNAGQIAFPGGIVEPGDGDDRRSTALRECEEELGIAAELVRIVAELPTVTVVNSSVRVTPFVGIVEPPLSLRVDSGEIARAIEVPLAAILAPGAVHDGIERFGGRAIATLQFDYGDVHVWGATGRMLADFVARAPALDLC